MKDKGKMQTNYYSSRLFIYLLNDCYFPELSDA